MHILIQDIKLPNELIRFEQYRVYRRPSVACEPIYFAPYFTEKTPRPTGISHICDVRGVLEFAPNDLARYETIIRSFTNNPSLAQNWIDGVVLDANNIVHAHYFLESKVIEFNNPLLKDRRGILNEGIGWISRMIPVNRRVTIDIFCQRFRQHNNGEIIL